jgi:hypothetical protein
MDRRKAGRGQTHRPVDVSKLAPGTYEVLPRNSRAHLFVTVKEDGTMSVSIPQCLVDLSLFEQVYAPNGAFWKKLVRG